MRKLLASLSVLSDGISVVQAIGSLISLLIVGGSGTITAIVARRLPIFESFGALAWIGAGFIAAFFSAIILLLVQWNSKLGRQAEYIAAMSQRSGRTNPLAHFFDNQIITPIDLNLPDMGMKHENKRFKDCKIIGPGAIALIGGKFDHTKFIDCGTVIVVPFGSNVTGIPVLKDCTYTGIEFYRVAIFTDPGSGAGFQQAGIPVVGVDELKAGYSYGGGAK